MDKPAITAMGKKQQKPRQPHTGEGHLRGPWEWQAVPEYRVDEASPCPTKRYVSGTAKYLCECTPPCKFALDQKQSDIDYYRARSLKE